jgi:hypothetical protein
MHTYDEERLQHMCGSHDLDDRLLQLYAIAQKLWHTIQTGPMSDDILLSLVIQAKAYSIPEEVKSPWDDVPAYTDVVVRHRSETPYEAEFVRRKFASDGRDIGQVEVRLFGDDTTIKAVPAEYVSILTAPLETGPQLPEHLAGVQQGDLVVWAPAGEEVQEVRFHAMTPTGQIHLKTGKTNSKNTYVTADEVSTLEPVEAG